MPKLAAVLASDNAKVTPQVQCSMPVRSTNTTYKVLLDVRSIIPKCQSFSAILPYNLVIGSARMYRDEIYSSYVVR